MRRLLYSGSQHRDDGSRGSKGILLIYFPRGGKLNSRFLDRVSCSPRGNTIIMIYSFAVARWLIMNISQLFEKALEVEVFRSTASLPGMLSCHLDVINVVCKISFSELRYSVVA